MTRCEFIQNPAQWGPDPELGFMRTTASQINSNWSMRHTMNDGYVFVTGPPRGNWGTTEPA